MMTAGRAKPRQEERIVIIEPQSEESYGLTPQFLGCMSTMSES